MAAELPRRGTKKPSGSWRDIVARGMCRNCGKPRDGSGPRCASCLKKERDRYRLRAERGECVVCGVRATAGAFCFHHWLRNIGAPYGLNKKNGGLEMLKRLWEQQKGRCAVTGKELTPGVNASLDHIVPVSRGGVSTQGNLRWVLYEINIAKADMTHEQFIEMCRDVVRAQDGTLGRAVNHVERSN